MKNQSDLTALKLEIWKEVRRCSSCGFCESVCPVYQVQMLRHYGPRGRINTIMLSLRDNIWTEKGWESVFSCLECGECVKYCPAGIDVKKVIRDFRHYIIRKEEIK